MPWKHEIYDVPNVASDDRFQHYSVYVQGVYDENFHYFGGSQGGPLADPLFGTDNQPLPLRSRPWKLGDITIERAKVPPPLFEADFKWTDLMGCHGTSGSGITQAHSTGHHDLLGPVARGDPFWGATLCQTQSISLRGTPLLAYTALNYTKLAEDAADDCGGGSKESSPLLWLKCHLKLFELVYQKPVIADPIPWPCITCPPFAKYRVWYEPMFPVQYGDPQHLTMPVQLDASARYRIAANITTFTPANVAITVAGAVAAQRFIAPNGFSFGTVSGSFTPTPAQVAGPLEIVSLLGDFGVNSIVVVAEDAVNDFDTMVKRAGVGLEPIGGGSEVIPMRFAGDGLGGYAAVLLGGERMVMTRQALLNGVRWRGQFLARGDDHPLTCGFVDEYGSETTFACTPVNNQVSWEVPSPVEGHPVAFFVENPADASPMELDDMTLASVPQNRPPQCSSAHADVGTLWPPNKNFVDVNVVDVTDPDGDPVVVEVVSVRQDEPAQGPGSGSLFPDAAIQASAPPAVRLRAERNGAGDGRVYHVAFRASDPAGAFCDGEISVCVPHDLGGGAACVDGGGLYSSTAP